MKEALQKFRDALLEKIPRKNYSPEQKRAITRKTAVVGLVIGSLIFVLLVIALFPVLGVQIDANQSHYTDEEIMDALDKSAWTPLLTLLPHRAEQRLLDNLLYLESAEVKYEFPATLRISVKEQSPLYYFYYDTQIGGKSHTGWLAVGPDLRVVDAARDGQSFADWGLTKLALPAPVLDETEPGRASKLRFTREEDTDQGDKTEQDFAYVSEFLSYLEASSLAERLTLVDLREKFDVRVTLDSQYRIDFGRVRDEQDFAQKLALAEQILASGQIDPDQKYVILLGGEQFSMYPAGDRDLDVPTE